jgi:hypothetical protein
VQEARKKYADVYRLIEECNEYADNLAGQGREMNEVSDMSKVWNPRGRISVWDGHRQLCDGRMTQRVTQEYNVRRVKRVFKERKKSTAAWMAAEVDSAMSMRSSDCNTATEHKQFDHATWFRAGSVYSRAVVSHFDGARMPKVPVGDQVCALCEQGRDTAEHVLKECKFFEKERKAIDRGVGIKILNAVNKNTRGAPLVKRLRYTSWITGMEVEVTSSADGATREMEIYTSTLPALWGWGGTWPIGVTRVLLREGVKRGDIKQLSNEVNFGVVAEAMRIFKESRERSVVEDEGDCGEGLDCPPPPPSPPSQQPAEPFAQQRKGETEVEWWHRVLNGYQGKRKQEGTARGTTAAGSRKRRLAIGSGVGVGAGGKEQVKGGKVGGSGKRKRKRL